MSVKKLKVKVRPASQNDIKELLTMVKESESFMKGKNWMFIPSASQMKKIKKYVDNDFCERCEGRIVLVRETGSFMSTLKVHCSDCGVLENITDLDLV